MPNPKEKPRVRLSTREFERPYPLPIERRLETARLKVTEETKLIKAVLKKAGFEKATVTRGKGTSRDWIHINLKLSKLGTAEWQRIRDDVSALAQRVTGRSGDYHGRINVQVGTVR